MMQRVNKRADHQNNVVEIGQDKRNESIDILEKEEPDTDEISDDN